MKFCSLCGATVVQRIPDGDNRLRYVCDACHTVHYQNPRIVAGSLPVWDGQVLLCRRAIAPRLGYWTLPAGFMENGETLAQAAARETEEEANARIGDLQLYTLFDLPHISQVYLFFRAELLDLDFSAGDESLEVRLFDEAEIPGRSWLSDHRPYLRMLLQRPPRRLLPGAQRSHCTYAGFL